MNHFGLKTIGRMLLLVTVTCCTVILLIDYSPIDPVNEFLGGNLFSVSAVQKANIAQHLGTTMTPWEQLKEIGSQFLNGNLGYSSYYQQPISDVLRERVSYSAWLLGTSWLITFVLGYALGLFSGISADSWWNKGLQQFAWLLSYLPTFWVGIMLIVLFSLKLGWFPVGGGASLNGSISTGYDRFIHLVLPVATLVLSGIGPLILHTREKVIELMSNEYVRYAQIHHLPLSTLIKMYIFKSSILPVVILHFAAMAEILGCSALIESVFNYPGLGSAFVNSGLYQDGALLIVLSIASVVLIALSNMLANVIQQYAQPSAFRS